MAQLSVQKVGLNGLSPSFTSATSSGDNFQNTGKQVLIVKNGGTASMTVTVNSQKKCNFGFDHDVSVTIGAGSEIQLGTFDAVRFNDPNNQVQITYSAVTSVTVAVIEVQ